MKSPQKRSERYDRERHAASERHLRKLEQMSKRRGTELVADKSHELEPIEHSDGVAI